jgi:Tfp pilus assembly protein PilO
MKIENRQQFLIVLTAIAFALLVGNSLVYEPLAKWWSSRADQIKTLRSQVTEGKGLLRREAAIRGKWNDMRANALTNNTSAAAAQVINALDNWSRSSSAEVDNIMPQWNKDSTNYMTFNCHVQAHGTLGALSQFVYQIEKGPMALKLDSMTLSARDEFGQNLQLDLQISGLALLQTSTK